MVNAMQDKNKEKNFWDKVASERVYAAFDPCEYENVILSKIGCDLHGKTIIDIGCASGLSSILMARLGATVVGVDISKELIEQANALWSKTENNVSFICGDAENLKINSGFADVVFFGGVLHHFPNKNGVMTEAWRVLKKDGLIVALEPNLLDIMERIEWKIAGWRKKLTVNEYPIDPIFFRDELYLYGFNDIEIDIFRNDIPFLNQVPLLKYFFSRKRGFWLKNPILKAVNSFRGHECKGNFFIITGRKI